MSDRENSTHRPMTKRDFSAAMRREGAAYDKQISADMLDVWWETFGNWTADRFRRALKAHRESTDTNAGRFFPKVADILTAGGYATSDESAEAWACVLRALSSGGGRYHSFDFGEIGNAAVRSVGGVSRIAMSSPAGLGSIEKQFKLNYQAMAEGRMTPSDHDRQYLPGLIEQERRRAGLDHDDVRRFAPYAADSRDDASRLQIPSKTG